MHLVGIILLGFVLICFSILLILCKYWRDTAEKENVELKARINKVKQMQPEIHPGWNDEYLKASDVFEILDGRTEKGEELGNSERKAMRA